MHLPTILHKRLLMHQPHKPALPQHANIPQPKLDKTLVHQIHRRANLQRHGRHVDVRREIRRVAPLLRVFGHLVAETLRGEEGLGGGAGAAESAVVAFGFGFAVVFVFGGGGGGEGEDCAAAGAGPFLLRAHEAEGGGFAFEAVEGEFEVGAGDEADEDAVAEDGEAAVELAGAVEVVEFEAELVGGDERGAGDVDEVVWVRGFGYVAELGGEDWADFGVEEGVGVHVGEEVVDACWLDGVGGPFGD